MSKYKLGKKCFVCGYRLLDTNKTGFCIHHRPISGINNPFFGKHHTEETKNKVKSRLSESLKRLWLNEEYRNKVIRGVSKPRRKSFKKEQSERIKKWYIDNPEQRNIRSLKMAESWKNGAIENSVKTSYNESKIEIEFFNELKNIFYDVEKYTIKIDGRRFRPDVLIHRDGIIIEFYGDYWHANPKIYDATDIVIKNTMAKEIWDRDEERSKKLEEYGYNIIIVWEKEYRENKELILKNIDSILNWESCSI